MADSNLNFRPNFDYFCFTKKNFAFCQAVEYIESLNLNELKLDKQVLKLREEKELHKKKIDDFKRKEYLFFVDNENILYNVFIAHLLFYQRDDKAIIEQCFILNERDKLLSKVLLETIAQLPLFTLTDCLNNKKNVVFYELNQKPFGISDEEYSKMRNWQSNKKLSPDPYLVKLFDLTFEEGLCQSKKAIDEFESKYSSQKIKEDKYHSVNLHKQNKIKSGLKMLLYPEYYRYLPERENVKRIFLNNCKLNKDIENQQLELIKTIVLYEKNKFIDKELLMMDREVICTPQDLDFIVHQMNYVLSIMVPDCELIDHWQQALNEVDKSMGNKIPILFIIKDVVETFELIYAEALDKLQHLFYYQPYDRIIAYVVDKINELVYLESKLPKNGPTLNPIIDDLMNHFRSDFKRAQFHQTHKQTKYDDLLDETKIQTHIKISFGPKKSLDFLRPIIEGLNDNFNFLDSQTTTETFLRIVTSDDLDTIKDKIYLSCKTNEFKYLIKYFKAYFWSFNPATIGKSGIFISNAGHQITAANLNSADMENVKSKFAIDNIFNPKR